MPYLLCAFVVVWLGLFAYLYGLVRRSLAREREVADLADFVCSGGPARTRLGAVRQSGPARPSATGVGE